MFPEAGQQLELHVGFPGTANASLKVHEDGEHATVIGYDARQRQLYVDRTKSRPGEPFHKEFPARFTAPLSPHADGQVRLQILLDTTSVEVFGNAGLTVITANTFPPPTARGWSVSGAKDDDGNDQPVTVRVWRLKSVWEKQEPNQE